MYTDQDLQNWRNPVLDIKDPLKQRWAELVQIMDTHINGICPLHIYFNCRPIESQNPFAIAYRVNNFEPNTKDAFDRALSGIIETCSEASVIPKVPDIINENYYEISGKEVYAYCNHELIRDRENDSNAVVVVLPKIKSIDEQNVSIIGVDIRLVPSCEIDIKNPNEIRFVGGEVEIRTTKDVAPVKKKYYFHIKDGQYSLDYPKEDGSYQNYPIVKVETKLAPYIETSSNKVKEGKYTLRLPYLYGSAAWGNKYYSQETDYNIQLKRNTYPREIRAKEKCEATGNVYIDGMHVSSHDKTPCKKCSGSGYVKDDTPLGTIFVDFEKLNGENKAIPAVVTWAEPPQAALTNSGIATDKFFDRMCESLGLIKQNNTNQSAVSKDFDYKEKLSVIYKIFNDNLRVIKEIYWHIETLMLRTEPISELTLIGELGKSTVSELIENLKTAKANGSPPFVIIGILDQIYQKSISPDISDIVIQVAKKYDVLYQYGSDDLIAARAQLGSAVTERKVIIHNTIIDVLIRFLKEGGSMEEKAIIKFLDSYYPAEVTTTVNNTDTLL